MKFLGMTLQRPTSSLITVAGAIATGVMLLMMAVHQMSAQPLHARGVAMWWVLGFWIVLARGMKLGQDHRGRAMLVIIAVDLLILLGFCLTGPL